MKSCSCPAKNDFEPDPSRLPMPEWFMCFIWGAGLGVSALALGMMLNYSAGEFAPITPAEATLLWPISPFVLGLVKIPSLTALVLMQVVGYTVLVFLVRLGIRKLICRRKSYPGESVPSLPAGLPDGPSDESS